MKIAPTLERPHQEKALKEALRLMTSGQEPTQGIFYQDLAVFKKDQDLLLKAKVLERPVDIAKAFDSTLLNTIPLADRRLH